MPNPISYLLTDFLADVTSKALFNAFHQETITVEPFITYEVDGKLVAQSVKSTVKLKRDTRADIIQIGNNFVKKIEAFTVGALSLGIAAGVAAAGVLAFQAVAGVVGVTTASVLLAGAITGVFTFVWSGLVNTSQYVINFDLNISDAALDAQLVNRLNSFYGMLGSVVGSSTGYLVCGAIPGSVAFAFNPGVAAAAMKDLDDDARAEVLGQVNSIARSAFQTLINAELANRFKSTRRFLKLNPDNPFAVAMRKILGEENFKKWGEANRPSFTIAQDIIEKRIESIKDPRLKSFLENALENFSDSCIESGFILANNFDSQLAAYSLMNRAVLGNPTDVVITFDD